MFVDPPPWGQRAFGSSQNNDRMLLTAPIRKRASEGADRPIIDIDSVGGWPAKLLLLSTVCIIDCVGGWGCRRDKSSGEKYMIIPASKRVKP